MPAGSSSTGSAPERYSPNQLRVEVRRTIGDSPTSEPDLTPTKPNIGEIQVPPSRTFGLRHTPQTSAAAIVESR